MKNPDVKLEEKMEPIETKLYNGEVTLKFEPIRHLYTVEGQPVDGVTSILGVIAKPALIAWAANMAADHVRSSLVPGQALDEIQIKELCDAAKTAHRVKRDKSADIGHMVHAWIENYIKTGEKTEIVNAQIKNGVDAFLKWESEHHVKFLASERKVYSKKHNYAGTCDFVAMVDGKKMLGDVKTGSGVYPEMFLQTAAYQIAIEEEDTDAAFDGNLIVNCRKDGNLEVVESNDDDYSANESAFLSTLNLYRWTKNKKS